MTDKDCESDFLYLMAEDSFSISPCDDIIKKTLDAYILSKELENNCNRNFKSAAIIERYANASKDGKYGFFSGCSGYPGCNFTATDKKPYNAKIKKLRGSK